MERFYDEIEIHEWDATKEVRPPPPITWTRKSEGANGLKLTYWPSMVLGTTTLSYDDGRNLQSGLGQFAAMNFLLAHTGGKPVEAWITLADWTHVGVQVLFEKRIPATATSGKDLYADTSTFELAHRPDLFPPEEIVAKWELTSTPEAPAPSRKPAQPGAAPR